MANSNYEILKKISLSRKSHRVFSNQSIDSELVEKMEEIALSSPYASGKKSWDFVIIEDKNQIEEIADAVELKAEAMNQYIREDFIGSYNSYAKNFTMFKNAPAIIILNFRTPASFSMMFDKEVPSELVASISEWERDNYVKSISCVAMQILLAAESLGLASCYMTGALLAEEEIKKIIPIKPGRRIGAIIPIGYKKEEN